VLGDLDAQKIILTATAVSVGSGCCDAGRRVGIRSAAQMFSFSTECNPG